MYSTESGDCMPSNSTSLTHLDQQLLNKGLLVQHKKVGKDGNGQLHQHMGYEIYLFHEGNATMIIGDHVYPLRSGDMLFISGEVPHISNPDPKQVYVRSVIHYLDSHVRLFPGEVLEPIMDLFQYEGTLIHWDISEQREIEGIISKMNEELNSKDYGGAELAATYLFQLLVSAYRKVKGMYDQTQPPKHLTQREIYVEQILAVINSKYNDEIDLDYISNEVNINKHYMCHCFKDVTGYTISTYIQLKRIEEAKKLLQSSHQSITAIGQCVGIRNVSHFSRLFKEHCGMSPSAYRKKMQSIMKPPSNLHNSS